MLKLGLAMPLGFDSFTASNESETAVEDRIVAYLQARGFQRVESPEAIHFRRGSLLGTVFGLSPRTWGADVVVRPVREDAPGWHVQFVINTTGQIVSGPERAFWEQEHRALGDVITGKEPESTAQVESAIRRMIWTLIGFGVAGAMLGMFVGLGVGLGLKLFGFGMFVEGATVFGGIAGAVGGVGFAVARIPR